jgi:hypothetical protein
VDLTDHDHLGYWAQTAARLAAFSPQTIEPTESSAPHSSTPT